MCEESKRMLSPEQHAVNWNCLENRLLSCRSQVLIFNLENVGIIFQVAVVGRRHSITPSLLLHSPFDVWKPVGVTTTRKGKGYSSGNLNLTHKGD